MKSLIVALFLLSAPALAASPKESYYACKAVKGAYSCELNYLPGVGGVMVVRKLAQASDAEHAEIYRLRDSFFRAGGDVFEVHGAVPNYFSSCSRTGGGTRVPFICEKTATKDSVLNRAKKD